MRLETVIAEMKFRIHNESLKLPILTGHTRNWFRNSFIFLTHNTSIELYFDVGKFFTHVPYAKYLLENQRFIGVRLFDNIRKTKASIIKVDLTDIGFSMSHVKNIRNMAVIQNV